MGGGESRFGKQVGSDNSPLAPLGGEGPGGEGVGWQQGNSLFATNS